MSDKHEQWQSVDDIAAILGVTKWSIYSGHLRRTLGWVRCGSRLRLPPGRLEAWAAAQPTTPPRCRREKR